MAEDCRKDIKKIIGDKTAIYEQKQRKDPIIFLFSLFPFFFGGGGWGVVCGAVGSLASSTKDLRIPHDIRSPHEVAHVHFRSIQNQLTSQVSGSFRTHTIEEAYCLSHQMQQFGAAARTTIQNLSQ